MSNAKDIVDYSLIAMSTSVSIANIESVLGIVMLSIQGLWLAIKLVIKVIDYIKNKKNLIELDGEVEDLVDFVGDIAKPKENEVKDGDKTNE